MDCSPPGSPVRGDSPGKNIGVGCHAFLQGIFPTQGLNQVSHIAGRFFTIQATRKPKNTRVGGLSLLQGIILAQDLNQGLRHCRWILYQLSSQGRPYYYYIQNIVNIACINTVYKIRNSKHDTRRKEY